MPNTSAQHPNYDFDIQDKIYIHDNHTFEKSGVMLLKQKLLT